jgi:hypothetical protein
MRTSAVADASASARKRSVTVIVKPGTRSAETLQQDVTTAVKGRLSELGLSNMATRVRVKGGAQP